MELPEIAIVITDYHSDPEVGGRVRALPTQHRAGRQIASASLLCQIGVPHQEVPDPARTARCGNGNRRTVGRPACPHRPKAGQGGRQPMPVTGMFRIYCLQQRPNLSDRQLTVACTGEANVST